MVDEIVGTTHQAESTSTWRGGQFHILIVSMKTTKAKQANSRNQRSIAGAKYLDWK